MPFCRICGSFMMRSEPFLFCCMTCGSILGMTCGSMACAPLLNMFLTSWFLRLVVGGCMLPPILLKMLDTLSSSPLADSPNAYNCTVRGVINGDANTLGMMGVPVRELPCVKIVLYDISVGGRFCFRGDYGHNARIWGFAICGVSDGLRAAYGMESAGTGGV